jgi:D-alanyl-D-alanine carboxypeptidase (penicillin-binding protein 5/6)
VRFRRGASPLATPPPTPQPSHVSLIGSNADEPVEAAPAAPASVPGETPEPVASGDTPDTPDTGAAEPPETEPLAPEPVLDAASAGDGSGDQTDAAMPAVSEPPGEPADAESPEQPTPAAEEPVTAPPAAPEAAASAVDATVPATPPETTAPDKRRFFRRQRRGQHRRSRRLSGFVFAILAVVVVLAGASAIVITNRLHNKPPRTTVEPALLSSGTVPGTAPSIPWPAGVQSAFSIPALGVTEQSGPQVAAPIASVTKLMTAHIVLTDHPLSVGEEGPSITITPNDVSLFEEDVASDQANIQVSVGEVLTEHQMLEGMLVHSANNFADLLAIWDAGSISAFVQKMNQTAAALGMTHTAYADASGFSVQSLSSPDDQLRVATLDMANPVIAQIVDMPSVTLPVGGTVSTFTPLLGEDGVVGVKSGFTSAAGGCDVLALDVQVGGKTLEVLAVVVGDHIGEDVITEAGLQALSVARAAAADVKELDVVPTGERVAVASARGHASAVVTRSSATVLAWPGQPIERSFTVSSHPRLGAPAGSPVGTLIVRIGPQKVQVTAVTARRLQSLTFLERVF